MDSRIRRSSERRLPGTRPFEKTRSLPFLGRVHREFLQWLGAHLSETQARAGGLLAGNVNRVSAATPSGGVVATAPGRPALMRNSLRLSASATSAPTAFARAMT